MKCVNCKYCDSGTYTVKEKTMTISGCNLTHVIIDPEADRDCPYHNADLTEEQICYNCDYYRGGGDWGLFCSHNKMYHHLGKFNDTPCEYYKKKSLCKEGDK